MSRRLGPNSKKVVGHDVDPIEVDMKLLHLGMFKILACRRSYGQRITVGAQSMALVTESVEVLPYRFEQEGEVFLVLCAIFNSGTRLSGILPIKVDAIERISLDQLNCA